MTLVKTRTATSSRLHEPITDCCTSRRKQKVHKNIIAGVTDTHNKHTLVQSHLHPHTIEDVVSRMHLAEQRHVFDWMTTGRSGANAGLTGDANSLQSAGQKPPRDVK